MIHRKQLEAAAFAICEACGENPHHKGDAQGNEYRWQDYIEIAEAGLSAAIRSSDSNFDKASGFG